MKMIFYKAGGKVVRHHPAPKEWTDEQIDEGIRKFNSRETNPDRKTAFVLEIQDGSVEVYLLACLKKRYRFMRDALQEVKDAVEEARDCLECLEMVEE